MKFRNPRINNLFADQGDMIEFSFAREHSLPTEVHDVEVAAQVAKERGGRLPTRNEIYYMLAIGALDAGAPDCWTSTPIHGLDGATWVFDGFLGSVRSHPYDSPLAVGVVKSEPVKTASRDFMVEGPFFSGC